jgi:hypothetical protein
MNQKSSYHCFKRQCDNLLKVEHTIAIRSTNSTPRYILKRKEICGLYIRTVTSYVYIRMLEFIQNNSKLVTTYMGQQINDKLKLYMPIVNTKHGRKFKILIHKQGLLRLILLVEVWKEGLPTVSFYLHIR